MGDGDGQRRWATAMGNGENAHTQVTISHETLFANTTFAFSGQNIETPLVTVNAVGAQGLLAIATGPDRLQIIAVAVATDGERSGGGRADRQVVDGR